METQELLDSLKSEWEEFKHVAEDRAKEIATVGEATAETKQSVERMQDALDKVEAKFEKLSLERQTAADGKTQHVKAFESWMRHSLADRGLAVKQAAPEPDMLVFSEEDAAAVLAPAELSTQIIEKAYNEEPLLGLVNTRRISRASVLYPTKESRAAAVREGAAPDFTKRTTEQGPFGKGEIKVFGAFAIADIEATSLEDPSVDLAADLISDLGWSFGQLEGPEILTGNPALGAGGILRPGPLAPAVERIYSPMPTTGDAQITYASLVELAASLNDAYDAGARFVLSRKTLWAVRLIEDTEGHLIWQPEMATGNPGTILGYPYSKSPNMVEIAEDAIPVLFGNFKAGYTLVQRLDVQVQRDPFTQWPHVRFKARKRSGGDVVLAEALKALVTGDKPGA